jgi:hypothetical protein
MSFFGELCFWLATKRHKRNVKLSFGTRLSKAGRFYPFTFFTVWLQQEDKSKAFASGV